MRPIMSAMLLVPLLLLAGGCAAGRVPSPKPVEIDREDYDRVFAAAVEVLREENFVVDRQDYRFGVVGSRPLASPTVVEFWRPGNVTPYRALQSTVNHQRRIVSVYLEPAEAAHPPAAPDDAIEVGAEFYLLRVEVLVEQLQAPINHMTGSTAGYQIIATLRHAPAEMQERGISAVYWQPVERDAHLEQRLLESILRRGRAS